MRTFVWYSGSVVMPRPTGKFVQDPDGWWHEVWTDKVWLDRFGAEERREPAEVHVRWREDA